tara:strand:+ start:1499 stop:1723 length:225 start_codon:yes stop_codon:yes gene_type:complete
VIKIKFDWHRFRLAPLCFAGILGYKLLFGGIFPYDPLEYPDLALARLVVYAAAALIMSFVASHFDDNKSGDAKK